MVEKSIAVQSNVNGVLVFKGENVIKILDELSMLHTYKNIKPNSCIVGTQVSAGDYIGFISVNSPLHYSVDKVGNLIPEETNQSECGTVDNECAIDLLSKKLKY